MDKENHDSNGDIVDEWSRRIKAGDPAALIPDCIGALLEDETVNRNDKRLLVIFLQGIKLLSGVGQLQLFEMAVAKKFFIDTARFWIYWSEFLQGAKKLEKIQEGLNTISNGSERRNLQLFLKRKERETYSGAPGAVRKYTKADTLYWQDLRKFNVGIVQPAAKTKRMYRHNDIYERNNRERTSLQEIKAKQWDDKVKLMRSVTLEAETADLKSRVAQLESLQKSLMSQNYRDTSKLIKPEECVTRVKPSLSTIQSIDQIVTGDLSRDVSDKVLPQNQRDQPVKMKMQIFSDTADETLDIEQDQSVKGKMEIFSDSADETLDLTQSMSKSQIGNGVKLSFCKESEEKMLSFKPSRQVGLPPSKSIPGPNISILTPLKDQQLKRDCSHLTPLAMRHPPTQSLFLNDKENPKNTPTAVVNDVNDLVQNFFNSTKVFHKDQTQFQDDTPQRQPTKTFLTAFHEDSPDIKPADIAPRRFSIFNDDSDLGSDSEMRSPFITDKRNGRNESSQNTMDFFQSDHTQSKMASQSLLELSLVSGKGDGIERFTENLQSNKTVHYNEFGGIEQSTRRITGGSDAKSDDWITRSDEPSMVEYHDPWSPAFVTMQLGQLLYDIKKDSGTFNINETFTIADTVYRLDTKIGEGNFANVYLCRNMFEIDKCYAVKVQKHSEPWEWVILNEAQSRVKNTSISNAISDAIEYRHYEDNCGVLITSLYSYGTLLQLCEFARPHLVKRSPHMKPFTLFYASQVRSEAIIRYIICVTIIFR